jgi:hypothetical protein
MINISDLDAIRLFAWRSRLKMRRDRHGNSIAERMAAIIFGDLPYSWQVSSSMRKTRFRSLAQPKRSVMIISPLFRAAQGAAVEVVLSLTTVPPAGDKIETAGAIESATGAEVLIGPMYLLAKTT